MTVMRSPFSLAVLAIFAGVIWPVLFFVAASFYEARDAKSIAEKNAAELADFSKSPFVKVTFDSIQINDAPPFAPTHHAVFAHVCDVLHLHRTAIVSENMQVLVGKELMTPGGDPLRLPAGSELFAVGEPNVMTPTFQVPSNAPRGVFLDYSTYLSDKTRPAPPYLMTPFNLCIVDVGVPLPTHGNCPQPPAVPPVEQPNCPAYTTSPQP